jgi:hypothetical protein
MVKLMSLSNTDGAAAAVLENVRATATERCRDSNRFAANWKAMVAAVNFSVLTPTFSKPSEGC